MTISIGVLPLWDDLQERWLPFSLGLLLFTLPISSSAKSIFFVLAILGIISCASCRTQIIKSLLTPYCLTALTLFFLVSFSTLWSPADFTDKKFVLEKYSKLLFLPLLIAGFQTAKARDFGIKGFLCAMVLTALLSILKFWGYLDLLNVNPDNVFRNHIMTGFMMAFAAYLCMLFFQRSQGNTRWAYAALICLFTYQVLCINGGRTGYVLYLLLVTMFLMQVCSRRYKMIGFIIVTAVFLGSYFTSSVMQTRINGIAQQVRDYKTTDKNTDIGLRIQYQNFAYQLFLRNPVLGNGAASFKYYFDKERPVKDWDRVPREPHSFYWLVASELGVLGLGVLCLFFLSLLYACSQLKNTKFIAFAMLICFMIGNVSDSLLFYSGSGYFFLIFMSLCLGEYLDLSKENYQCRS